MISTTRALLTEAPSPVIASPTPMLILGPWQWHNESGFGYHGPPLRCRAAIDLTPPALPATAPGEPRGVGLFVVDDPAPASEYVRLAAEDPRDARPDRRVVEAWESHTGYRPRGDSISDLLWDQLTAGSDPAGIDGPAPLVPQVDGRLPLWFGRQVVREDRFEWGHHSHTSRLRDLIVRELQSCRDQAHAGALIDCAGGIDFERHRRIADAVCEKYRIPLEEVRPFRWPVREGRLPHETVVTDNFNRPNGSLGASSEGWSWTGFAGAMQIASNRAVVTVIGARFRAEADLSGSDNEAAVIVTTRNANVEIIARYQSAADTCYRCVVNSSQVRVFKTIGGAQTQVGTSTLVAWPAVPFSIGMRCNGSTLDALVNGVPLKTIASDTSITSGTRCGLGGTGGTSQTYDDWSAADLVAGSVRTHPGMSGGFHELAGGLCA